jgi:hypothetical protein
LSGPSHASQAGGFLKTVLRFFKRRKKIRPENRLKTAWKTAWKTA